MTAEPHLPPTAPGALPLLGHALPILKDRLAYIQQVRAHGPVVRVRVGPKKITVVNAPELIHEMLTSRSHDFNKGFLLDKLRLFGNDPLPISEGDKHLRRRRLMHPPFHREKIAGYIDTMSDAAEPYVSSWRERHTIDVRSEMQLMAQGVIMSALFSLNPEREYATAIRDSVDTVFGAGIRRALVPLTLLERLPTPGNRRLARASALLRATVADIVVAHRANPDAYDDIVSLLVTAVDEEGEHLPEDEIVAEVTALIAAGSETTAVALAWLFHELGCHPDLERRLHEEVDSVLQGDTPTAEHLPRLAFTRRLVSESLRMHHPGWFVTRQAVRPVRLGGFDLPAGEDVVWSPYALHRDPTLFPDPLRFDPDRWLPDRPKPVRGAFIPFGTGKRMCIGDAFAWSEAVVITALIASRWQLRPTSGAAVRPVPEITVHPASLRMIAHTRQHAVAGSRT